MGLALLRHVTPIKMDVEGAICQLPIVEILLLQFSDLGVFYKHGIFLVSSENFQKAYIFM